MTKRMLSKKSKRSSRGYMERQKQARAWRMCNVQAPRKFRKTVNAINTNGGGR